MKMHGDLRLNVDVELPVSEVSEAKKQVIQMKEMQKQLIQILKITRETQKQQYDKKHKFIFFKIKDEILLQTKNICMIHLSHKLNHYQLDSFHIVET